MQRVGNIQSVQRQQLISRLLQTAISLRVDPLQECRQFAKCLLRGGYPLDAPKTREKTRQLTPVTLGWT
jgi:hypothetical protein